MSERAKVVAILAGQLAALAAKRAGPSGPFTLSVLFLAVGSVLCAVNWEENVAPAQSTSGSADSRASVGDALRLILADRRIALVGAVQALFEVRTHV